MKANFSVLVVLNLLFVVACGGSVESPSSDGDQVKSGTKSEPMKEPLPPTPNMSIDELNNRLFSFTGDDFKQFLSKNGLESAVQEHLDGGAELVRFLLPIANLKKNQVILVRKSNVEEFKKFSREVEFFNLN